MKLILVHSKQKMSRVAKEYSGLRWVYFGTNYRIRLKWEDALGTHDRISYKKDLRDISYSMRDEYVELINRLGKPFWTQWEWWMTRLANRNTLSSQLYLNLCYLEVLKLLIKRAEDPLVLIIESPYLFKSILSNAHLAEEVSSYNSTERQFLCIRNSLRMWFRFVYIWSRAFLTHLFEMFAVLVTGRQKGFKKDIVTQKDHMIIHTCVQNGRKESDLIKDHFYPELSSQLQKMGNPVSILAWTYNVPFRKLIGLMKKLRNSEQSFLISQDYLSIFQFISSFQTIQRSSRFIDDTVRIDFKGLDVKDLIKGEQTEQKFDVSNMYFLNLKHAFKQWKTIGINVESFIMPWEFKYYEVPAVIGLREHFPDCRTFSYLYHSLIPMLLMANFKTTTEELEACPLAKIRIVNSELSRNYLIDNGFPSSSLKLGPALRYRYLQRNNQQIQSNGKKRVVVFLPMKISSACEVMWMVFKAFGYDRSREIYIRAHPFLNIKNLKRDSNFDWPAHFCLTSESQEECFINTKVAIVCDTGIMVEILYRGIKTIVLSKETDLDLNFLDTCEQSNEWFLANDSEQLKEIVRNLMTNNDLVNDMKIHHEFFEFDLGTLHDVFEGSCV